MCPCLCFGSSLPPLPNHMKCSVMMLIALASALTLTEAAASTRQKLVAIVLPNSTAGSVRVLHVDSKPVARSYDGLDWERTQGGATLGIDCSGGACQARISTGSAYTITSHDRAAECLPVVRLTEVQAQHDAQPLSTPYNSYIFLSARPPHTSWSTQTHTHICSNWLWRRTLQFLYSN